MTFRMTTLGIMDLIVTPSRSHYAWCNMFSVVLSILMLAVVMLSAVSPQNENLAKIYKENHNDVVSHDGLKLIKLLL